MDNHPYTVHGQPGTGSAYKPFPPSLTLEIISHDKTLKDLLAGTKVRKGSCLQNLNMGIGVMEETDSEATGHLPDSSNPSESKPSPEDDAIQRAAVEYASNRVQELEGVLNRILEQLYSFRREAEYAHDPQLPASRVAGMLSGLIDEAEEALKVK